MNWRGGDFIADAASPSRDWLRDYIPPEDHARTLEAIRRAIETKGVFELEHKVRREDGEIGWAMSRAIPILDAAGEIVEWFGAASDITARKQAEVAQRESEARLAAEFESVPVGLAVIDMDGKVVTANQQYRRFLPHGTLPSRDPGVLDRWRAWDAEGRPLEPGNFPGARAIRGERVVPGQEMLYTSDDGREVWTSVASVPIHDTNGQVTAQASVISDIDDAKRTADALRENELKYRSLFQSIDDGYALIEFLPDTDGQQPDFRFVEVNDAFERQTGNQNVTGKLGSEINPGDDAVWIETFSEVARTNTSKRFEIHHQHTGRWYNVFATRVGGDERRQVCVVSADTTERRSREAAQRDSEQRFRALATTGAASIYRMSPDWRLMFELDGGTLAATANPNEDWIEKYIPEDDLPAVRDAISQAIRTKSMFELEHRVRLADGGVGWVRSRAVPLLDEQGEIVEWFGAGSDVTERREAVERLRDSEARFQALFAASPVPFMVLDPNPPDFIITAANEAYFAATLTTPETLVGRRLFDVFTDDPRRPGQLGSEALAISLNKVLATESTDAMERVRYDLATPEGFEPHWWLATNAPLLGADGNVTAIIHQVDRQTERHYAEEAEREREEGQAFLLKLSNALRPLADTGEITEAATRLLGEQLSANRVYYVQWPAGADYGEVTRDYATPGTASLAARYPIDTFRSAYDRLCEGRTWIVEDNATADISEPEREHYASVDVIAWVDVPLIKRGRVEAALCVVQDRPREWTAAEIAMIDDTAERVWAAVERARVEAALGASEKKHRSLFETMGQGYGEVEVVRDADGRAVDHRYFELNPAFERLVGIPAAHAKGRLASEVIPGMEPWWHETFGRVARGGVPEQFEFALGPLDRWFSAFAYPQGGDRLILLYEDMTDRKRAETALRDSEERQTFLLKLGDALRAEEGVDAVGRLGAGMIADALVLDRVYFVTANLDDDRIEVTHDVHHADMPPMLGTYDSSAFPNALKEFLERPIIYTDVRTDPRLTEQDRQSFVGLSAVGYAAVPIRRGGGTLIWAIGAVSTEPRQWTAGEIVLLEEAAERIWAAIERARAEAALHEEQTRFRQFADASTNVLWIRDAQSLRMTFASPAFDAIYGIPGPDRGGDGSLLSWARLIEPESRKIVFANFRRVRAGERIEMEFRMRRASDGALRWVQNTDFPLRDAAGKVQWIAGVGADITDAKEAGDRQEILVAELQHRTRNLVAVVRSIADKTVRGAGSLENFKGRFQHRLESLARVQGLLSRTTSVEKISFDELLRSELAALAGNGTGEKVTLDGPAGVPLSSSTVQTFALALHELATNATNMAPCRQPTRTDGSPFAGMSSGPTVRLSSMSSGRRATSTCPKLARRRAAAAMDAS